VIATSTKLDISGVKLPDTINDKYFKRNRQKRAKKAEGDIFNTKKEVRKGKILQTVSLFPVFVISSHHLGGAIIHWLSVITIMTIWLCSLMRLV
jgi:hypothetical protein